MQGPKEFRSVEVVRLNVKIWKTSEWPYCKKLWCTCAPGQRWMDKTVHSTANPSSWRYEALLEILGKLQKANAQERIICFARFCQTRLNCEFILHTLMFLDHKHLSNLRIFKPRLRRFFLFMNMCRFYMKYTELQGGYSCKSQMSKTFCTTDCVIHRWHHHEGNCIET